MLQLWHRVIGINVEALYSVHILSPGSTDRNTTGGVLIQCHLRYDTDMNQPRSDALIKCYTETSKATNLRVGTVTDALPNHPGISITANAKYTETQVLITN